MKKYISLSICALSLATFTACDMDAPTQSALDETTVYSQYGLAEKSVMAINDCWGGDRSYRNRQIFYVAANTDIEWWNTPTATGGMSTAKQNACNYATTADNTELSASNTIYSWLYQGVEKANIAIKNLRTYGNVDNDKKMAQLLGEALTLRALIYLELMKMYGDVPGRFEPSSNENANIGRTSQDIIYKQILADLSEAENYCYWPGENDITKTTERVSKSFVKGLRARVALHAGGYRLFGDGTYRLTTDEELAPEKMFQIARDECVDVINAGHNQLGTFEQNFKNLCKDVTTAGLESIWEIPFNNNRGQALYNHAPRQNYAKNQWTDYDEKTLGGGNGILPTFYYDFDREDIRRDITCVIYQWGNKQTGTVPQIPDQVKNIFQGKLRYEWMDRKVTSQDDGVNWQMMRYADILMMAAEAENELNGPANAVQYLKPVLDRALPAAKVSALIARYSASKDAFREGIIEQRAFEFAGENIRKFDLIRWGIIDQKMAEAKTKLHQLANREGDYADLPEKLYYTYESDGITLRIYGNNHGDTDEKDDIMAALGVDSTDDYKSKGWLVSSGAATITDDMIDGLYLKTPSTHCVWPIPQYVIDLNNGLLNNDFLNN